MKIKSIFLIAGFFLASMASSQSYIQYYADVSNQVSQTNITTYLTEFENLGVKRRGTQPLEDTYNWLRNKYLGFGYTNAQFQEDTFINGGYTCKNLVVTKVGTLYPNTFVIICGHYDSIVGTGTNDNGSGIATILEVARLLQNIPTEYSIKFINFSGEEDGLVGSQHYVNAVVNATNPKLDIKLVFNLDEVGGVAGMTNNTITCERDTGTPTTNNAASNTITNELITCVGLYSPLNTYLSYAYASDYMPFEDNNEVITGFFETNETSHKHSATDLLINMDPVYNYNVAKAATGAMMHFAVAATTLDETAFTNIASIRFFPNPVKDNLYIDFGILPAKEYEIEILDVYGKKVFNNLIQSPKQLVNINISHLNRGIYLVQLSFEGATIRKKIIIE
ncbi:M28 family peptidase [Flavobacterium sp. NRK F7]|uniref:M28 family peptidase n=1 Tax=Flavobacterium sp. NRK F7 TaxID=2954930 RepID=UPI002090533E|nr:M28 family peptidase [Flavobacterium sp. NRK F7]MCO6163836.1 M28 family peptidase [Flavobacterium sp. NRK F7]